MIEDSYKYYYVPSGYTEVRGKLVLIYKTTDLNNNRKLSQRDLSCLQRIVGNRVNERQLNSKTTVGGGAGNGMRIIFSKDGKIKRLKAA